MNQRMHKVLHDMMKMKLAKAEKLLNEKVAKLETLSSEL